MNVKINLLGFINKIPGGLVLFGMFCTMLVNTFFPNALQIGYSTTGLFTSSGIMTMVGMLLFISGSQIRIRQLGTAMLHGSFSLVLRVLTGIAASVLLHNLFGLDGFLGIPTIALVICLCSLNPGTYLSCMQSFGNEVDKAAFGIFNLWGTPAIPLMLIGISTGSGFDWKLVVATLVPFLLGFALGNLDSAFQKLLAPATPVALFFIGFMFGANIDLRAVFTSGLSGLLLTVIYMVVSLPISVLADKFILRGRGYAGAATCAVGSTFIASAGVIAIALPQYAPYVAAATAQVATAAIITPFICPIITGWVAKKFGCPVLDAQKGALQNAE